VVEQRLRQLALATANQSPEVIVDIPDNNSEFLDRLRRIEFSMNSQFRQNQTRLSSLENSITKLLSTQSSKEGKEKLGALASEANSQRQKLTELESKIAELRREVLEAPIFQVPTVIVSESVDEPVRPAPAAAPDLSAPLAAVQKDIESFRGSFDQRIEKLQQKSQLFEAELQNVTQMAQDLSATAQSLEQRVREADSVSQAILARVTALSLKIKDNSDRQTLQALAARLRAAHDDIRAQVTAVQGRLKECTMSIPLEPR
jgi:seryl-tRNA synthetase